MNMKIEGSGREYRDVFDYLKQERPEFYSRFRLHYSEKRGAFPEMSERGYLLWVMEKMSKRAREKLERTDESIVDEGEVKKLEGILRESKSLGKVVEKYSDVQSIRHIDDEDRRILEGEVVDELRTKMTPSQRRAYSKKNLTIRMRRLNLGPWRYRGAGPANGESIEELMQRRSSLFGKFNEIAKRILIRAYEENGEIKSQKTFRDYRRKLKRKRK
jgi:hypothetical protein